MMNSSKLILFDFKKKQWEWSVQRIKDMPVFDDLAEFLADRIYER